VGSADAATMRAAAAALAELAEHAGHVLTELHSDRVLPLLTHALAAATEAETALGEGCAVEAGAHTRPLFSST